jgi:hypothetical protein
MALRTLSFDLRWSSKTAKAQQSSIAIKNFNFKFRFPLARYTLRAHTLSMQPYGDPRHRAQLAADQSAVRPAGTKLGV